MSVGVAATIKEKLDIVDLIGETVQLKKAGTTFKGLCPFHGEKTPSFTVTPTRETWKCFGCGRGGDAERKRQRDGLDAAISFYHQVLTGHPTGEAARTYLHDRGFTDETIEAFGLGWAPDAWDAMTNALTRRRNIAELTR